MKKNFRVCITDGKRKDSFTVLGDNKHKVRELCDIVHIGSGWAVENVTLAMKRK